MKKVLFFGTFDPLHAGHRKTFHTARALGNYLIVVVARDGVILKQKKREPYLGEQQRLARVAADPTVDEVILGDTTPSSYTLFKNISFDILALGYDQKVDLDHIRSVLQSAMKRHVQIVRLQSFYPNKYKSSLLRLP